MAKSKQSKKNAQAKQNLNFFAGIQHELKHVTWPTREETIQLTITVLIISLIVAVFVGIIDFSLAKALELLSR